MAAKIQKKYQIAASGILDITDGHVFIENEDTGELIDLAELFEDFAGKDVKLSIAYGEDF
jgi:hypothetical protein